MLRSLLLSILIAPAGSLAAAAGEIRVAVAANFAPTAERLAESFERSTGSRVVLLAGSSGQLYAQIRQGLRVDLFLSADAARPLALERDGLAVAGSRSTYAVGRLALWRPRGRGLDEESLRHAVATGRLAIANPRLAPYGEAAREVLEALGLWDDARSGLLRGENVTQAFQFVASGNADLGLVALAQILRLPPGGRGAYWVVPADLHRPIEQQVVLLRDAPAPRRFLDRLGEPATREVLIEAGYDPPGAASPAQGGAG